MYINFFNPPILEKHQNVVIRVQLGRERESVRERERIEKSVCVFVCVRSMVCLSVFTSASAKLILIYIGPHIKRIRIL